MRKGLFIKYKPFKMFLIVPLGLLHIDFSPNSLTLVSSAKYDIAESLFIQNNINTSWLRCKTTKFYVFGNHINQYKDQHGQRP